MLGKLKSDLFAMCMGFLTGKEASLKPESGLTLGRAQKLHAPGFPRSFHSFFLTQKRACIGKEKLECGQSRLIELVLNYTCIP